MIAWLAEYGMFLAKAVTLVGAVLVVLIGLASAIRAARRQDPNHLQITHLNDHLDELRDSLEEAILDASQLKRVHKERKKQRKEKDKRKEERPRTWVLRFEGDVQASAVRSLREEITAVLQIASDKDEVIIRLDSPGGLVHAYGLAASQLVRIRERGLPLTVVIDKVAASGGYLMASVANRILSAPFAVVGSIGVVAQIPNINRLLKKHDIDVELHTAGEFKRTLTVLGENTDEGRAKFREELEQVHVLFKNFVTQYRPELDISKVATGEHWHGSDAIALGLVDGLSTSDDLLMEKAKTADLYEVRFKIHHSLKERVSQAASLLINPQGSFH